jgi:FdhD protein
LVSSGDALLTLKAGKRILRWRAGTAAVKALDDLAVEEPLEIRVDTRPVSVTMRTPGDDDELAAGFLFSEALIRRRSDIARIAPGPKNKAGNVIDVLLKPDVRVDFQRLQRSVFVSSSCGLCGKASIDSVHQHFSPIKSACRVAAEILLALPAKMRAAQQTFERTGGLHAAALFSVRGELVVLREDIGRHNAVDKVIGFGLLNGLLPFERHVLLVSGRASFEILQKALAARMPIVCAVSAPSSLAVEFARASGMTLAGFLRDDRLNIYSGEKRIDFSRK